MRTVVSHISLAIHTLLLFTPSITQATASPQPRQTSPPPLAPSSTPKSSSTPIPTLPPTTTLQEHNIFSDLLSLANLTSPLDLLHHPFQALGKRCANPCGYYSQVCCGTNQQCYTNALTQAACTTLLGASNPQSSAAANGYWSYYTSYTTATETLAQVYSTWIVIPAATSTLAIPLPTAPAPASPTETESAANCADNQISCGPICCNSGTYCLVSGQCAPLSSTLITVTIGGVATTMYSAPLRVTTSTLLTVTQSISPTTTEGFQPAIATANVTLTENASSNGGGLSGGAIAGIVVGVVVAVCLLILLCVYLCFREIWYGIFGGRRDNRRGGRRVTEEEWRRRSDGRGDYWYGQSGGGRRPPPGGGRPQRPRRDDGGGGGLGWLGVGAGLAGLAAALGWQRRQDRKNQQRRRYDEKSSSSYTDSRESESTYLRSEEEVDRRVFRNGRLVDESDFRRETREHRGGR